MAATHQFKIYNPEGVYIGSMRSPAYAAPVIALLGDGSQLREGHRHIIWQEGREHFPASESYDAFADVCLSRVASRSHA